jgi:DNA-binding MltR family transcriptional regulator
MTDIKAEPKRPSMFRETPGSIKTLRQSYKDRTKAIEELRYQKELTGESDRSAIILMASTLEDGLVFPLMDAITRNLKYSLSSNDFDRVFRFEGPLGTFSSRLEIACLFGVIEDATYEQLTLVRELRNVCAHSKQAIDFGDATLKNVARRLFQPLGKFPQPPDDPKEIRNSFMLECMLLFLTLLEGSRESGWQRMKKGILELARNSSTVS